MQASSIYQLYKRYRTLQTDRISSLPVVILMPHSACNCRCVMCDIWKGNHNLKQLSEEDIRSLLGTLNRLGTKQVLMSGGEALLHTGFFRFCEILKSEQVKISLLSTGFTIKKHAENLLKWVDEIIVSLDGHEQLHDDIRNIPGAYQKLYEGIRALRALNPEYKISGRTVIQRLNFRSWPLIIDAAKELGLNRISFLPADVSSSAFNREVLWSNDRKQDILLSAHELGELKMVIGDLLNRYRKEFNDGFISESPDKIRMIYSYYAAFHGYNELPYKKCNAPWVSTVIEADGSVRPCFFHEKIGNIHHATLDKIINSKAAIDFRKNLDMDKNETCKKCVCYLNLRPGQNT